MPEISSETLVVELARSLHASGSPAYELDQRMEEVAVALGKPATFFSTPTALFVTFAHDHTATRLLRVYPGETNLGRYAELYDLQRAIQVEGLSASEAWERLQAIDSRPDGYSSWLQVTAYGFVGACVGVLVGGNGTVVLAAGLLSALVGVMVIALGSREYPAHLVNVIAGFVASAIACTIQVLGVPSHFELISLSALIVLVPGLNLTISINELATQNLASGSARIAGALTTLLTLVFGVYMGFAMVDAISKVPPSIVPHVASLLASVAVTLPIGMCLAVLFRTRRRDIFWVLLSTIIGYGTLRLAGEFLNAFAAVWIAALVSGLYSRFLSQRIGVPASVMLMPALILLVPGSLGFSGLSQILLSDDLPSGIRLITTMMLTAAAIVAGLLLSEVVNPIRKASEARTP